MTNPVRVIAYGGEGDDTFDGGAGNDIFYGGVGVDRGRVQRHCR